MHTACKHTRREMIARRDGIDYERCLDCDQVLEADDLEADPPTEEDEELS
jgi:hypothetical protein